MDPGSIPGLPAKIRRLGRLVMQRIVYPSNEGSIPFVFAIFGTMIKLSEREFGTVLIPDGKGSHFSIKRYKFYLFNGLRKRELSVKEIPEEILQEFISLGLVTSTNELTELGITASMV